MKWSYGVTTMPSRQGNFLKESLASLSKAGFGEPRLFVDSPEAEREYDSFGFDVTSRSPTIRPMGNWWLSLWELFIREPHADRYAIFQDDILCCSNLREYLERDYPECGYLNLITFPQNLQGTNEQSKQGWFPAPKKGKGAQGLVFNEQAVVELFQQLRIIRKFQETTKPHRSLDGAVYDAFDNAGYVEYVHNPSLLYHLGASGKTSIPDGQPQPLITSFPGEDYNPLTLV